MWGDIFLSMVGCVQYHGGYLKYCGDIQYHGDIMLHVGDIVNTVIGV